MCLYMILCMPQLKHKGQSQAISCIGELFLPIALFASPVQFYFYLFLD